MRARDDAVEPYVRVAVTARLVDVHGVARTRRCLKGLCFALCELVLVDAYVDVAEVLLLVEVYASLGIKVEEWYECVYFVFFCWAWDELVEREYLAYAHFFLDGAEDLADNRAHVCRFFGRSHFWGL